MQQKYSVNISLDFEASVLVLFTLCEDNLINITMMPSLLVTFQNSVFKLYSFMSYKVYNNKQMVNGRFLYFFKVCKKLN